MKRRSAFVFNLIKSWCHFNLFFLCILINTACNSTNTRNGDPAPEITEALADAGLFLNSGQIERSISHFDSVYNAIANKSPLDTWERYNFYASFYLKYEFDLIRSEQYLDSMYLIMKNGDKVNDYRYVQTKFMEGDILKAKQKYNNAFLSFFNGREHAIRNLDNCNVSNLTYRLGIFRYGCSKR